MTAADPRSTIDGGERRRIKMLDDESVVELPYRKAVSLISRGLAEWAKAAPKPRRRKKAAPVEVELPDTSDAATEPIVDSAENEPAHNLL